MRMTSLKYFPRHAIDENGFLYRKGATYGKFMPCKPYTHHKAGRTSSASFYFDQEGESYKLTLEELKRDGENAKGRML